MKAYNILEQAVLLAGGTTPDENLKSAAVGIINTVLTDLDRETIDSLSDELRFPHEGYYTVLTSGVAMILAVLWGDDAGLSRMNDLYTASRRRLLRHVSRVRETAFGGGADEI